MFAMELALHLGQPNVDHMLRSMTAEQFAEWENFFSLQPYGNRASMIRTAWVCATIANLSPKVKKTDFSWHDFMPRMKETPKTLSNKLLQTFKAMSAARAARK